LNVKKKKSTLVNESEDYENIQMLKSEINT